VGTIEQRLSRERQSPLPRRRQRTRSTPPPSATRSTTSSPRTRPASRSFANWSTTPRAQLSDEGIRGDIFLFKNNTDSTGNSYGCHENYCIERIEDLTRLEQVFIPFLISRQIFTGAGKVVTNAKGTAYSMSQRAEHIWEAISSATTRSRPDHQHPRRAPRRPREVSPSPRHRR
jgi:hypothetical protein